MAPNSAALDRDLARVRAVADTYTALQALKVSHPEADAERLYSCISRPAEPRCMDAGRAAVDELGGLSEVPLAA